MFDGRHKLILEDGQAILFDLAADPEERIDVSAANPAEVARLAGRLGAEAARLDDPLGCKLAEAALGGRAALAS